MAHWLAEALTWIAVLAALAYAARRLWRQVAPLRHAAGRGGIPPTGCASCNSCGGCPAPRADAGKNR